MLEFKRKKREEEKAKESREANNKSYEDYPWTELCEDVTKLRKLRIPELNKYLNRYGLKQHLKSSKSEKVKAILRHSCLQQKSPLRAGQPTLRYARTLTQNDNWTSAGSSETDESDNDSMTVMPLTLGEKMTQVMSILHSSIQMSKMPVIGQMPHAQGEP